jgi:CHC2-type zinc finger protein
MLTIKRSFSTPNQQNGRLDPVPMRPNVRAIKEEATERYARDALGVPAKHAKVPAWLCPFHQEKTPSFKLHPEPEPHFHCYGCDWHGDVIDLCQQREGHERPWEAMVDLSVRYGIELPGRPESWHRKQARQRPIRDHIARAKFEHLRRRLFRSLFEPSLLPIEDPREREEEARLLWEATEPLARMMLDELNEQRKTREEEE